MLYCENCVFSSFYALLCACSPCLNVITWISVFVDTDTSPKAENFLWGIFHPKSNCQADMDDTGNTADMEVDMVGGKMVGTVDVVVSKDSSTPCTRSEPIMTAVQQLLSITKMDHSSYQAKIRALDSAIKQLLGVQSEELKDTDTSASSGTIYFVNCT